MDIGNIGTNFYLDIVPFDNNTEHNVYEVLCPVYNNTDSVETGNSLDSSYWLDQDMGTLDVVRLIGLLGWSSVTVLYDAQSEKLVERIILNSGVHLQGVQFLTYNTSDWMKSSGVDTLLQELHIQMFPHLNFLLIGREDFAVTVMSKVTSHDSVYNRTTDYQHSSRWIIVTDVNHQLIQTLRFIVDGRLDNLVLMCTPVIDQLQDFINNVNSSEETDFNIMTWSRSFQPPRFVFVRVTSPVGDRRNFLDTVYPNVKYGYNNRTFIVSTLMWAPFTIRREEGDTVIYEGYCFEVLNLIAEALNFSVQLVAPPDGEWGLEKNGTWTGLVGQMQERKADMVVAPLTMHEDRAKVMDFILPAFHTENVDILYRHEDIRDNDVYTVLRPYKYQVLVCIAATVVGVVVVIFYLEQWIPYSSVGSKPTLDKHHLSLSSTLWTGIKSCMSRTFCPMKGMMDQIYVIFWGIFGTLFKQAVMWDPVASSTRVLMSGWWLLTLVLSAGYSAYLVASLAVSLTPKPFKTLQDVVDSNDFKLGIMSTGIIKLIFEKSKRQDFKQAWNKVLLLNRTDPGVLAGSENEHVQKVLGGKYCWITDVTTAEKSLALDCELDTVGVRLNGQQLAIGVPTNSPLTPALEGAMSAIADSGLLGQWWRRWQKTRSPEMCPKPPPIRPISMKVVMGPIYVAAAGIGVAGIALLLEIGKYRVCQHKNRSQHTIDR